MAKAPRVVPFTQILGLLIEAARQDGEAKATGQSRAVASHDVWYYRDIIRTQFSVRRKRKKKP